MHSDSDSRQACFDWSSRCNYVYRKCPRLRVMETKDQSKKCQAASDLKKIHQMLTSHHITTTVLPLSNKCQAYMDTPPWKRGRRGSSSLGKNCKSSSITVTSAASAAAALRRVISNLTLIRRRRSRRNRQTVLDSRRPRNILQRSWCSSKRRRYEITCAITTVTSS
jgi:hypothetical protein